MAKRAAVSMVVRQQRAMGELMAAGCRVTGMEYGTATTDPDVTFQRHGAEYTLQILRVGGGVAVLHERQDGAFHVGPTRATVAEAIADVDAGMFTR